MDRISAIERWRVPLLGHLLELFAEIGLTSGGTVERVPKPLHRYALRILRTAEAAVRRLIVAAARDIVVEYEPRRPAAPRKPKTRSVNNSEGKPRRKRRPLFNLCDPLKRFGRRFKKKIRRPEPHVYSLESFLQQRAASSAASWPSWMRFKTSPATRCGSRSGRPVPRKNAVPSAGAPCASAGRRDFASGPSMRSMRS
jgi:hypothetical protein